ncbi:MAG: hypothetical protein SNJ57_02050 [Cyanobacteriota bacterium]
MRLELVMVEVGLGDDLGGLQRAIAQALVPYGEPLRWAVTRVESDRQWAQVEAVVIVSS